MSRIQDGIGGGGGGGVGGGSSSSSAGNRGSILEGLKAELVRQRAAFERERADPALRIDRARAKARAAKRQKSRSTLTLSHRGREEQLSGVCGLEKRRGVGENTRRKRRKQKRKGHCDQKFSLIDSKSNTLLIDSKSESCKEDWNEIQSAAVTAAAAAAAATRDASSILAAKVRVYERLVSTGGLPTVPYEQNGGGGGGGGGGGDGDNGGHKGFGFIAGVGFGRVPNASASLVDFERKRLESGRDMMKLSGIKNSDLSCGGSSVDEYGRRRRCGTLCGTEAGELGAGSSYRLSIDSAECQSSQLAALSEIRAETTLAAAQTRTKSGHNCNTVDELLAELRHDVEEQVSS